MIVSTHAPLAGRDKEDVKAITGKAGFQPTRPLRGATGTSSKTRGQGNISTHAPLAGRDMTTQRQKNHGQTNFNPRAPCGARPFAPSGINSGIRFQPTRPLRGATAWEAVDMASDGISTHAPLAGRDEMVQDTPVEGVISTHAPLAGRDGAADRSARGERISTHAPLAGRDRPAKLHQSRRGISTHAPLAGRDGVPRQDRPRGLDFNPRAPCGARRSSPPERLSAPWYFNPRAPCGARPHGRDDASQPRRDFNPRAPCGARPPALILFQTFRHFNPRAPCGARPGLFDNSARKSVFQPTRPLRGATDHGAAGEPHEVISTHAPLAGRDVEMRSLRMLYERFQPTRPLRGATVTGGAKAPPFFI